MDYPYTRATQIPSTGAAVPLKRKRRTQQSGSGAQARDSTPGRKRIELPMSTQEGLVRFVVNTDAPFDTIAEAVNKVKGGPGKQCLRKWLQFITGTRKVDNMRLKTIDPQSASERHEAQEKGLKIISRAHEQFKKETQPEQGHDTTSADLPSPQHPPESMADRDPQPTSRQKSDSSVYVDATTAHIDVLESEVQSCYSLLDDAPPSASCQGAEANTKSLNRAYTVSFADQFREQSIGGSSVIDFEHHASWPVKRSRLNEVEEFSNEDANSYVKRRRLAGLVKISEIAELIEEKTGQTGRFRHYAKQLSGYAETIFSLAGQSPTCSRSSTFSTAVRADVSFSHLTFMDSPDERRSEFERFYDNPSRCEEFDVEQDRTSPVGNSAISIVIDGRIQRASDGEILNRLNSHIPTDPAAAKDWVNKQDKRGVSALHLTVAYGHFASSSFLSKHEADLKAKTLCGASIQSFAKPAAELARPDISLYFRISNCRAFIRRGQAPPIPKTDGDEVDSKQEHQTSFAGHESTHRGSFGDRSASGSRPAHVAGIPYPDPHQVKNHPAVVPLNLGGPTGWNSVRPDLDRGLTMSPVSMRSNHSSLHSFNMAESNLGWSEGGRELRKLVGKRNTDRSRHAQRRTKSGFDEVIPSGETYGFYPSRSYIPSTSPASQSVPNLGSFSSPLASNCENAYAESTFEAMPFSLTQTTQDIDPKLYAWDISNFDSGWNTCAPPHQDSMAAPVPVHTSPCFADPSTLTPLSLAPEEIRSMPAKTEVHEYTVSPGWPHTTSTPAQTVSQPAQPTTAEPDFLGLRNATTEATESSTVALSNGAICVSATSYGTFWISCIHDNPISHDRTYCPDCPPLFAP